jgi:hypothetical protein
MLHLPNKKKLGKFMVYSHTQYGNEQMWNTAKLINAESKLKKAYKDSKHIFALQGERISNKVQKGIYGVSDSFYVFNVKDLTENRFLSINELLDFCNKYGFNYVPIIEQGLPLNGYFSNIEEVQEYVEHKWFKVKENNNPITNWTVYDDRVNNYNFQKPIYHRHEGVVIRGMNNEFSFKVKSNNYQIEGL